MIELESKADQDFIISALENWREIDEAPVPVLEIGGEDYSDAIPSGDWSQDGIAFTLETTFVGDYPLRLLDAPVSLDIMYGGVKVPAMRGFLALMDPEDDLATDKITVASAGSLADKYHLNEVVEWPGIRPDRAVRDALRRLPYARGGIRVQPVSEPLMYAAYGRGADQEPFAKEQLVNDLLAKVQEKVPYIYRDTAWGGNDTRVSSGLVRVPEIPDFLRFNSLDLPWWKSPALALQRFARVLVFKQNPDGSDAFDDAIANVPSLNPEFPVPFGLTERIPWTGDAGSAQKHAYERALYLGRGQFTSEPTLPPFPLLERTDVFTITEAKEEEPGEGFFEREWLHWTDTFEQAWGEGGSAGGGSEWLGLKTNPTCSVGLLNEQFVKAPILNMGLITGGITRTVVEPVEGVFLAWGQSDLLLSELTQTYGELN